MIISKTKLQEALEIVRPGLANNESIEQTTSFAFIEGSIVTYNDEISISHPVPSLEIRGAVIAEKLYLLLSKIKKDEIDISIEDSKIVLQSGRAKASFTLIEEIKLPLNELSGKKMWKDLPENFNKHLKFAMASCGRDMSRPVLTCVNVKKTGVLEASDGYKITSCELSSEMPVKDFLLPVKAALNVVKLQPVRIAEGKGWVHFQTEEMTTISCRIFEDVYPEVSTFLNIKKGIQIVLPITTEEVLDRAIIFAKRSNVLQEMITITLEKNRFKIHAVADDDAGEFEEEINFKYDEQPISFSITPYLLKGILSETQACELSENKLKFKGDGWEYLTLLRG